MLFICIVDVQKEKVVASSECYTRHSTQVMQGSEALSRLGGLFRDSVSGTHQYTLSLTATEPDLDTETLAAQ